MEWTTPKNVADLKSFLGLVGYYHQFVKGFSKNNFSYDLSTEKWVCPPLHNGMSIKF